MVNIKDISASCNKVKTVVWRDSQRIVLNTGCDCRMVESDEIWRSGGASWPNGKETEEIRWLRWSEDNRKWLRLSYCFLDLQSMQRLQGRSDVHMAFGVRYYTGKSILDMLETPEFSLGETKIKWVAIIQFRMNKYFSYCGYRFQNNIQPYATEVTNVIEARFTEGRNLIMIR